MKDNKQKKKHHPPKNREWYYINNGENERHYLTNDANRVLNDYLRNQSRSERGERHVS